MNKADLDGLNQTFATVERAINNLNARMQATMAFVAALPGADAVHDSDVRARLATASLGPVLGDGHAAPEEFVAEAVQELCKMARAAEIAPRPKVRTVP